MNGQTGNEQVYDNEIDRDGSHTGTFGHRCGHAPVRTLYHTLFVAVKAGVRAAAGSIALGFRIFTSTAEWFGPSPAGAASPDFSTRR